MAPRNKPRLAEVRQHSLAIDVVLSDGNRGLITLVVPQSAALLQILTSLLTEMTFPFIRLTGEHGQHICTINNAIHDAHELSTLLLACAGIDQIWMH
jgi:hypothetical protein